jgi:hypothetical protein
LVLLQRKYAGSSAGIDAIISPSVAVDASAI